MKNCQISEIVWTVLAVDIVGRFCPTEHVSCNAQSREGGVLKLHLYIKEKKGNFIIVKLLMRLLTTILQFHKQLQFVYNRSHRIYKK